MLAQSLLLEMLGSHKAGHVTSRPCRSPVNFSRPSTPLRPSHPSKSPYVLREQNPRLLVQRVRIARGDIRGHCDPCGLGKTSA